MLIIYPIIYCSVLVGDLNFLTILIRVSMIPIKMATVDQLVLPFRSGTRKIFGVENLLLIQVKKIIRYMVMSTSTNTKVGRSTVFSRSTFYRNNAFRLFLTMCVLTGWFFINDNLRSVQGIVAMLRLLDSFSRILKIAVWYHTV